MFRLGCTQNLIAVVFYITKGYLFHERMISYIPLFTMYYMSLFINHASLFAVIQCFLCKESLQILVKIKGKLVSEGN